ncbi:ribonuclease [Bacillus pseudomycoides]|uniref:Ribonuclease n=1 Tax=Bacillus pseudomycoides TaxID=64104 RepID=A0AA91ZVW0_9BACI|nr:MULTISPECIES: YlzJ-like family protein [Bacillus]PEB55128.1 ribonuclease [Bacillus sp. AFS098217]PED84158.1 ribonuclease [Bacillus pseudomycoides]PEU15684.1 ribonuclease [Bacillus sp. AFS019443]PEU21188.1 ribonuclease [Bacillus sp. AFS014408]PFW65015.1 ribonuclease [Bacillus sp. AFS075034]
MILYTIMPEQVIYPADYSQCESQKIVNVNGVEMVVSEENNQSYSIVRVLSTDPSHYLQYEPGQKITF